MPLPWSKLYRLPVPEWLPLRLALEFKLSLHLTGHNLNPFSHEIPHKWADETMAPKERAKKKFWTPKKTMLHLSLFPFLTVVIH